MKKVAALLLTITATWPTVAHAQVGFGPGDPDACYVDGSGACDGQKKQWDAYAHKHALPIARSGDKPSVAEPAPRNSGPTNMLPPGYRSAGPAEKAAPAQPPGCGPFIPRVPTAC